MTLAVGLTDNAVELYSFEAHTDDAGAPRSPAVLVATMRVSAYVVMGTYGAVLVSIR